jgi:hypothetical protein
VSSEHLVQLFDTETSRAQNVAGFIARGLAAGEPAILVVRPATSAAIVDQLQALGVAPRDALEDGRLVIRDAEETLRSFSPNGVPDPTLFLEKMVPAVRQLAGTRRLWACGEMVDILAQRGDLRSALMLETLWNDLARRIPMMLLCAYSSTNFVSTATHSTLIDICTEHSNVHRDPQDPLGNWLLTAAHNGGGSGSTLQH